MLVAVSMNNNQVFIVQKNILFDVLWGLNMADAAFCNKVFGKISTFTINDF